MKVLTDARQGNIGVGDPEQLQVGPIPIEIHMKEGVVNQIVMTQQKPLFLEEIDPAKVVADSPDIVVVGAAVRAFMTSFTSKKWIRRLHKELKKANKTVKVGATFLTHVMPEKMVAGRGNRLNKFFAKSPNVTTVYSEYLDGKVVAPATTETLRYSPLDESKLPAAADIGPPVFFITRAATSLINAGVTVFFVFASLTMYCNAL